MAVRKLVAMAAKSKGKEEELCGESEQKLAAMVQLCQEKEAALQQKIAQEEAQQLLVEEYRKTICVLKREMEGSENALKALVEFQSEQMAVKEGGSDQVEGGSEQVDFKEGGSEKEAGSGGQSVQEAHKSGIRHLPAQNRMGIYRPTSEQSTLCSLKLQPDTEGLPVWPGSHAGELGKKGTIEALKPDRILIPPPFYSSPSSFPPFGSVGVATRTGAAEPRRRTEEAEDREGGIDYDHPSVRGSGCSTVVGRPAETPMWPHL
ncbi:hypothetical protein AAFF_G00218340 [Aldrovandia affinis]|uniref:Uncharacterized protein n=1 Tax=Aldrovandia affinis TaxID=143900 RepID=A0AAD7SW55_9TELE|nr:hypothetical protein AAFF_G00218340 [Aldrovandia affinis]